MRLGIWGGEWRRRKGVLRARIEALLAVWGQAARVGGVWAMTYGSLGVKEPTFLEFSQAGSDASAGTSPAEGSAWAVSAARSVASAATGGWLWSSGRVGSVQKIGSLAAAAGWE